MTGNAHLSRTAHTPACVRVSRVVKMGGQSSIGGDLAHACVTHHENGSRPPEGEEEPLPVSRELTPEQRQRLTSRPQLAPQPAFIHTDAADADRTDGTAQVEDRLAVRSADL